jgi:hypothetical protein
MTVRGQFARAAGLTDLANRYFKEEARRQGKPVDPGEKGVWILFRCR